MSILLILSVSKVVLPNCLLAAAWASAGPRPERSSSFARRSRCKRTSSSNSCCSELERSVFQRRPSHAMLKLLRLGQLQHAGYGLGQLAPALLLAGQLPSPRHGNRVVAGPPVVVTGPPFGADPALLRHAMERRIQRSLLDPERVSGNGLNVHGNAVSVHRSATRQRLQHQQIQGPLKAVIGMLAHSFS